ncbi:MAG TPA: ArsA-related P-loop ATPase [Actinomycetota bacterium]|nr:ArsA-related P-loop ATPase [Actinomycetota bacterium]
MDIDELLRPKILVVSGKGGVGKTTVSAALALVAARHGRKVCIAEVDRKGTLPKLFGRNDLTYDPHELSPGVWGMNIIPDQALAEYLDVQYHMKRIARVFSSTHFVDFITATAPGLKDILVLGKIWYLEQGRTTEKGFDNIILDAPAAGHMLSFLSAPSGLSEAVKIGPVQRQADWLVQMLCDGDRTRVHLVSLPEEMPVSETLETAEALRDRLTIATGTVFANAVYPEFLTSTEQEELEEIMADGSAEELQEEAAKVGLRLEEEDLDALVGYARFLGARRAIQAKHLRALRRGVDQPVAELPFLFSAGLALPGIETIADAIEEQVAKL